MAASWPFSKLVMFGIFVVLLCGLGIQGHDTESLETECRPYVEKALKEQLEHVDVPSSLSDSQETQETTESPDEEHTSTEADQQPDSSETADDVSEQGVDEETQEVVADASGETEEDKTDASAEKSGEDTDAQPEEAKSSESEEQAQEDAESIEQTDETKSDQGDDQASTEQQEKEDSIENVEEVEETTDSQEETPIEISQEDEKEEENEQEKQDEVQEEEKEVESQEQGDAPSEGSDESKEETQEGTSVEETAETVEEGSQEETEKVSESKEASTEEGSETVEESSEAATEPTKSEETTEDSKSVEETVEAEVGEQEETKSEEEETKEEESKESVEEEVTATEETVEELTEEAIEEVGEVAEEAEVSEEAAAADELAGDDEKSEEVLETDEDELTKEFVIPEVQRPRDQLIEILHLDEESSGSELALAKAADATLRELKRLYDSAIKPLEILYKYRDLSNRHFGDPEIFSKPLILFMGPWSGGKSSIINYLLDNEYNENSLRTGAEPSPAYFNIVTWGPEPEILDGTQLAADWTFSGLQKFGQGLEDRLRGLKLPNKLLEMVNIVEIPGILEVRKQVSRVFPFNDACQWFIDRADIIFLVYDPSKLDVGPETEAILDQLKGREYQTRVILNKADIVKPEELLRVQGALLWNISPLMSSAQPPIIYTTSLWSTPYNSGSPVKLLQAQERAFLRDIRQAIDKRVDNKIASARRFAVRVRNHAKMVDCYLTTYYNHKTFFGNRKQTADDIIENPQSYHIYEGLSTLKNISRYDLPDPDTYRDFFKVNPLYDFQQLSSTCTYFKGCPINRLDVCIAYDLPELVGKHKKLVEQSVGGKVPLNS